MDITPEMQSIINGLPTGAATPEIGGGLGRVGKNFLNLPINVAEGIVGGVVGLAELGLPAQMRDQVKFPNFFDIPAPKTTGDVVGDFIVGKGGLADTMAQILLPASALGRVGKAMGIAEGAVLDTAKFAVGETIAESGRPDSTPSDVAVAGVVGGMQAPLAYLPMRARLPLSGLLAGLHGLYENEQRGPISGGVTAGADFLSGLIGLPGKPRATQAEHLTLPAPKRLELGWEGSGAGDVIEGNFELIGRPYRPMDGPIYAQGPEPIRGLPEPRGEIATLQNAPMVGPVQPRRVIPANILEMPDVFRAGEAPPRMPNLVPERMPLQLRAPEAPPASTLRIDPETRVPVEAPPTARPVEPRPAQRIKWTPEEQAYAKDLAVRYSKFDESDLKEIIFDLDNEIANSLDEPSIRSYNLSREVAQDSLNARRAPTPETVTAKPAKVEKVKRNQRVTYNDELGEAKHGTVVGFTKTEARVVFDGESGEVTVPRTRISTTDVPDKGIATLQKSDIDDVNSAAIGDNLESIDSGMQRVGVEAIDAEQSRIPGRRERVEPEDLHGAKYAPSTGTGPDLDPQVHMAPKIVPDLLKKLNNIIKATVKAANPNIEVSWVDAIKGGNPAINTVFGQIEVSMESIAKTFADWPTMSATRKNQTLVSFAQLIGHETGHSALLWLRANNQQMYKDLIKEFKGMSEQSRYQLLQKFYRMTGRNPMAETVSYSAGNPAGILGGYPFLHPKHAEALDDFGMEEFFAEMFSAKMLGLLDEKLLPKEMKTFWERIKDVFQRMVALFTPSGLEHTMDMDEFASLQVFQDMVDHIAAGFRKSDEDQFMRDMVKGSTMRDREFTLFGRQSKKLKDTEDMTTYAEHIKKEEELKKRINIDFEEDPNWVPEGGPIEYVAKGAPPFSPTLRAAFAKELTQEVGAGLAGAIIGGVAGPDITDGQVSMSEGILMGGVLGALGPRAIKALLAVPKSTGATFHHKPFHQALKELFQGGAEGVAADAANGHGSSVAKFLRFLERNVNLHLPPELFNAMVQAEGAPAWALHTADDAFKKVKNFKESPAFIAATEAYLKGGALPLYRSSVAGLGKEATQASGFYVAAREAIATLQNLVIAGLPEGKYKEMMVKSLSRGDYLTRQFKIFHDAKYRPTQTQVEAVAQKYVSDRKGVITLDAARAIIEDYIHEIKKAGTDFRGSVTDVGKKFDSYLWERRETLDPVFRDMLGEYHDPREKVLGTIQHIYTSAITGKLINSVTGLKDSQGLNFSYGMEEHSILIDGLMSQIKRSAPPPGKTIATLQKELDTLRAYVPLDTNLKHGKLAGKMVSRFVRDQLATFDSPWGLLDGTIMRTMAKFHNAVKIARAPLNPITVVRNIFAMPILAAVGGVGPTRIFSSLREAHKIIRANGAEAREMIEQGIFGVDAIRGEMLRNIDYVRMLDVDDTITGMVKKGVNKALEFYRWPDMLVRGATYINAKTKFSKDLGLPETHPDVIAKARDWTNRYTVNYANVAPIVKTLRQVPFTNLFISYTAEMTRITKNLVQDAFRHTDPAQRVRAASILGGLAAAPFALEKFSEMQLSEKDRKDWEKARALMPDYQRTKHLIVMGREKDGRYRYIDMTPLIQIDSMTQMGRALAAGDMSAASAVNPIVSWENTPAINIVSEQLTGEDLRSGRPINKNLLTRAKAVLDDIVPPILPGGYEYRRWSEALSPTETGDLGITNVRTGRRTTPGEIVGSYLTGMRIGTVDADKLHQFAVADAKRKIANEAAYLRDVVQTNSSQRVKEKAIERYRSAQQDILLELTQKLQVN